MAYDFIHTDKSYLTAAVDLNHFNDVNEKVNVGLEYRYNPFSLRASGSSGVPSGYAISWRRRSISAARSASLTPCPVSQSRNPAVQTL